MLIDEKRISNVYSKMKYVSESPIYARSVKQPIAEPIKPETKKGYRNALAVYADENGQNVDDVAYRIADKVKTTIFKKGSYSHNNKIYDLEFPGTLLELQEKIQGVIINELSTHASRVMFREAKFAAKYISSKVLYTTKESGGLRAGAGRRPGVPVVVSTSPEIDKLSGDIFNIPIPIFRSLVLSENYIITQTFNQNELLFITGKGRYSLVEKVYQGLLADKGPSGKVVGHELLSYVIKKFRLTYADAKTAINDLIAARSIVSEKSLLTQTSAAPSETQDEPEESGDDVEV